MASCLTVPTYFTVDAGASLHEGLQVTARGVGDPALPDVPAAFTPTAAELAPAGVSPHGALHLLTPPRSWQGERDAYAELLLELARRLVRPEAPSRLSCLFAFAERPLAERFARERRGGAAVYEVQRGEAAFLADQHLAGLGSTPLVTAAYARAYWAGEAHPLGEPLWEALLPLPVRIGARVL